jgi:hypothetical protein
MIDGKNLSYTELAAFIGKATPAQRQEWQRGTIRDWAYGMMAYRPQVYRVPPDGKLGYRYAYEHFDTVQQLLLQGGIRLAGILNQIYK